MYLAEPSLEIVVYICVLKCINVSDNYSAELIYAGQF